MSAMQFSQIQYQTIIIRVNNAMETLINNNSTRCIESVCEVEVSSICRLRNAKLN